MLNHEQLKLLPAANWSSDYANSVGSKVVRCVHDGRRAVAVAAEAASTVQIGALLDLLDLHLSGVGPTVDRSLPDDEVVLLLGAGDGRRPEPTDALLTLIGEMRGGPRVRLLVHEEPHGWVDCPPSGFDVTTSEEYARYAKLLAAVPDEPPALVQDLIASVGHDGLRAYPMLSSRGKRWSVRLEGLQIGVCADSGGWVGVGEDGVTGNRSPARTCWIASTHGADPVTFAAGAGLDEAVRRVRAFAHAWVAPAGDGQVEQDEHALESRILRGSVKVEVGDRPLDVLRAHGTVNWGSQFPTKWGRGGSARYLDGLLRDGRTPWAIEMKIQGGTGVGQYYRHAIHQAVLYRSFIRRALPLHPWFAARHLDAAECRTAVVIPELLGPSSAWAPRLQQLCDLFDVSLVQVPHEAGEVWHPTTSARSLPAPLGSTA